MALEERVINLEIINLPIYRGVPLDWLYSQLPADVEVTTTFDHLFRTIWLRIWSSKFKEVLSGNMLPKITHDFNVRKIDLNSVLDPAVACTCAGTTGVCSYCMNSGVSSNSHGPVYATSTGIATPSPWGYQASYQPAASGYAVPAGMKLDLSSLSGGTLTKRTGTSSCSHSWKSYQGLSETFEYCVTCQVKRA